MLNVHSNGPKAGVYIEYIYPGVYIYTPGLGPFQC